MRPALEGRNADLTAKVTKLRSEIAALERTTAGQRQDFLDETDDLNSTIDSLRARLPLRSPNTSMGDSLHLELCDVDARGASVNHPSVAQLEEETRKHNAALTALTHKLEAVQKRCAQSVELAQSLQCTVTTAVHDRDVMSIRLDESELTIAALRKQLASQPFSEQNALSVSSGPLLVATDTTMVSAQNEELRRFTIELARRNKEYRRVNRLLAADVKMFLDREKQREAGAGPAATVQILKTVNAGSSSPSTLRRKGASRKRSGKSIGSPLRKALSNSLKNTMRNNTTHTSIRAP